MYFFLIAIGVIALDQLTKWAIVKYMTYGESIPIIDNLLYITSHRNRGAAWGILEGRMGFFFVITIAFVIGIIVYIIKYDGLKDKLLGTGLALVMGGAIGNFIDRFFRGEVVDFISTYIGSYPFPIFNVADSALCIGVAIIFVHTLLEGKKEAK